VLFDEVQTLPVHLLEPLLSVWRELRDQYGVSFVFSTATQPAFRKQANLENGFVKDEVKEITADTEATFKQLRRVRFELPRASEKRSWPDIAAEMRMHERVLCVVNTRKQAFALWQELSHRLTEEEHGGLFHLSSAMCAEHRLHELGAIDTPREGSIRWRLQEGLPCRVVSTQLVEAGVDLDFPVLYRAIAPLDSIVQAAGRCNRESLLPELGRVIVFNPEDESLPQGTYATATQIAATMLSLRSENELATDHALFAEYFTRLYQIINTDREGIQADRQYLNFRSVASKVRVIEEGGIPVVVPYGGDDGPAMKIVKKIRGKNLNSRVLLFGRADLRSLQRYMVNVRKNDLEALQKNGQLTALVNQTEEKKGIELQVLNVASYHKRLGVVVDGMPTDEWTGGI
jgi:CRISPR-associated endonuclease/helicase Cas3